MNIQSIYHMSEEGQLKTELRIILSVMDGARKTSSKWIVYHPIGYELQTEDVFFKSQPCFKRWMINKGHFQTELFTIL